MKKYRELDGKILKAFYSPETSSEPELNLCMKQFKKDLEDLLESDDNNLQATFQCNRSLLNHFSGTADLHSLLKVTSESLCYTESAGLHQASHPTVQSRSPYVMLNLASLLFYYNYRDDALDLFFSVHIMARDSADSFQLSFLSVLHYVSILSSSQYQTAKGSGLPRSRASELETVLSFLNKVVAQYTQRSKKDEGLPIPIIKCRAQLCIFQIHLMMKTLPIASILQSLKAFSSARVAEDKGDDLSQLFILRSALRDHSVSAASRGNNPYDMHPLQYRIQMQLAQVFYQTGSYSPAMQTLTNLQNAISSSPSHSQSSDWMRPVLLNNEGILSMAMKKVSYAEICLLQALQSIPDRSSSLCRSINQLILRDEMFSQIAYNTALTLLLQRHSKPGPAYELLFAVLHCPASSYAPSSSSYLLLLLRLVEACIKQHVVEKFSSKSSTTGRSDATRSTGESNADDTNKAKAFKDQGSASEARDPKFVSRGRSRRIILPVSASSRGPVGAAASAVNQPILSQHQDSSSSSGGINSERTSDCAQAKQPSDPSPPALDTRGISPSGPCLDSAQCYLTAIFACIHTERERRSAGVGDVSDRDDMLLSSIEEHAVLYAMFIAIAMKTFTQASFLSQTYQHRTWYRLWKASNNLYRLISISIK